MKKILTVLLFTSFCISAFSQKKSELPKVVGTSTVGTSTITKKDKLIDNFTIKNKKYKIYLGNIEPNWALEQEKADTLLVYKIIAENYKYSELEFNKYATRKGKIIRESFYNIKNDTLTIIENSYDLHFGAYRTTSLYITNKYGLEKISDSMTPIDTDKLSDKYLKPREMLSLPKN